MSKVSIREVIAEDVAIIYDFVCKLENETFDKELQSKIFLENLKNTNYMYLIAFVNQKAVGFVTCHGQLLMHHQGLVGEIQEMFVAAEARGLGIGKKLIEAVKEKAKQMNFVQLEVTSGHQRVDAHRFYERENFKHSHKKFVYHYD